MFQTIIGAVSSFMYSKLLVVILIGAFLLHRKVVLRLQPFGRLRTVIGRGVS